MANNSALNDILHFFAPILDVPLLIEARDDYILETQMGCFRVAYSPSTHTTALFYARHPDDLGEAPDETGPMGIRHKDRLILIKMFKVRHNKDARWDPTDPRQQFDLTWLRREIATTVHNIPRDQFREANLHRVAKDFHSSVFVGYRSYPSQMVEGEFSGDILTKTDKNYLLLAPPDIQVDSTQELRRLFHRLSRQIVARMGPNFPLRSIDPLTHLPHTSFKKSTMRDIEQADFAIRLQQIEDGLDPVHWREAPLVPLYRGITNGRDRAAQQMHRLQEIREGGIEEMLRHGLPIAAHLLLDGGISFLGSFLIDTAGQLGVKEKLRNVTPEWHQIVDQRAKRLILINSNLHRRQIRPIPEHFGDLRWINPAEHACSFSIARPLLTPDPERTFRRWTQSLFFSPYASLFEYRGINDEVLAPDRISETCFVSQQVSNGMMLYYIPVEGMLYAYYNRQDYTPTQRKLPVDARNFLNSGQVLQLNMRDKHAKINIMPFDDFQQRIRLLAQAPELTLPTADTPTEDIINSVSAPVLATRMSLGQPANT